MFLFIQLTYLLIALSSFILYVLLLALDEAMVRESGAVHPQEVRSCLQRTIKRIQDKIRLAGDNRIQISLNARYI